MPIGKFISIIITFLALVLSPAVYSAPGDILDTIEINNIAANANAIGQAPVTPHGVTFYGGYMWVMDFGTDRIYRVYTSDTVDAFGNPVLKGDSDFNIPVTELTIPKWPNGSNMAVCGAYPGDQYCGGGGLVHINGFLWNASPVTDNILKIDPTDGAIQSEHIFTNHSFPAPSSLTYDGTHFWVIDWQNNTINKVLAETGEVLAEYDGPSNISNPRPTGIVWDGLDLWLSYEAEERIYRVRPSATPPVLDILDFFDAPGALEGGSRPKGLSWDGEFLWHADAGTGKIYKLETDIMPFGVGGCIMKNDVGVRSRLILSQTSYQDKVATTDADGCFVFPAFIPGVPIALELNESGVNAKPFIKLNETLPGTTDVILIQGAPLYNESAYDFIATDAEDGNLHDAVTATPNIIDNPSLINTSILNETGYVVEYNVIDSAGNHAEPVYRKIYVLKPDVTPPVIVITGGTTITIEQNINNPNLYEEFGASATDDRDGNVTADIIIISGSVNSSVAGTYLITYTVADAAGNRSSATRTIKVQDTTAPTITLLGSNPLQMEKTQAAYVDPGARASDNNVSGAISLNASNMTGVVSTDKVGTYKVVYSYADAAGNQTTATRTVNVVDTGRPTITLNGSATINHEINVPYSDAGAVATDEFGEIISANVIPTGSVNANAKGTYTLTYNISDKSGNAAPTVTRQVIVDDTGTPTISLKGNATINLQKNDPYVEEGANAVDAVDDNAQLTANIVITGTVNTSVLGTYTRRYNVTDSAGNKAVEVTRTIIVSDTGIPVITLKGNSTINLQKNDPYVEEGANAVDAVDDNAQLTAKIVITGTVNSSVLGTYTRRYNVTDSSGNAAVEVTRTIIVSDTGIPVITLKGNQTINLQKNDPYVEEGANAVDAVDDDAQLTAKIVITGTVNSSVLGTYTRRYNVTDSSGNKAVEVTRTIIVSDTGIPVITLNGNAVINLLKNATYSELGARATDAGDDDNQLTVNIVITGTVDTSRVGTYMRRYNVTDSSGNKAVEVTRIINVTDTNAPTITLIGPSTVNHQQRTAYTDPGASAFDNEDGDMTSRITVNNPVNVNTTGTYVIRYNVKDLSSNSAAEVTRTVIVSDANKPVITLLGNAVMDHPSGTTFVDPGYTAFDTEDGDLTSSVVATFNNSGSQYLLSYNVTDSAGNRAVTRQRTVNVVTSTKIDIQAEAATIGGTAVVATTEPGFTGSGYIDLNPSTGSVYLEYALTANAVPYNLAVRFAGTGTNSVDVILNGNSVGRISLNATGSNSAWQNSSALSITPRSGSNTLRLNVVGGASLTNIDSLTLTP